MTSRLEASRSRLQNARDIAVKLKHDARLHRLAMQTVFVLEDCYESLVCIGGGQKKTPPDQPPCLKQPGARLVEHDRASEATIEEWTRTGRAFEAGGEREPASHEKFLLEEGLDMLARYRAIGDPQVRLMIRQLIAAIADSHEEAQRGQGRVPDEPHPPTYND